MKVIKLRGPLTLVCLLVFAPLCIYSNTNYAKVIETTQAFIEGDISNKSLNYNLYISHKFAGSGEMNLSIEEEKISGTALGISKINQYKVDFSTNIKGAIDLKHGNVNVLINGTGNPIGIFAPGKVTYNGPLKGQVKDKILRLAGMITIKGKLAKFIGLSEKEPITIEIPDPMLLDTIAELKCKKKLASL